MVVVSLSPDCVVVNYKGRTQTFKASQPEYASFKEALKIKDAEERDEALVELVVTLRTSKSEVTAVKKEDFRETPEGVYVYDRDGNERLLPPVIGKRLLEFYHEGLPYEPILKFSERLLQNPSYTAVQRLFACLEHNNHPILPDGRLLAWKRVTPEFKDFHTRTFDNSIGKTVKMPRNEVDEDNRNTCSKGLHIASYHYASHFYQGGQGELLEVAVDPKDVVAIPFDYEQQKMRVCEYEVLNTCEAEDKALLSKHSNDFVVDPNDVDLCERCDEHVDFCECGINDNFCLDCDQDLDDCYCGEDDEDDDEY